MALNGSQYADIQSAYSERRRKRSYLVMQRKAEIYDKIPEFKELDARVANLSVECTRKMILAASGNDTDSETRKKEYLDSLHEEIEKITARKSELLDMAGIPADYLDPPYECDKCKDTGYVGDEKCTCLKQMEVSFLYEYSNMKSWLEDNNYSKLSDEYYVDEELTGFRNAVANCREFIENFGNDPRGLFFYGTPGTGKSFLSGCVAKVLLDRGYVVIYFSAKRLFDLISDAVYDNDRSGRRELMETLYDCDLLIIDDLGTEGVNDFSKNILFDLLNERMIRKNPVIISTNMSLDILNTTYRERISSRILSSNRICKLKCKDIRIQKANCIENRQKK